MPPTGRRRGIKSWIVEPYKQVKLGLLFLLINCIFSVLILGAFGYYVADMYEAVSAYFKLTGADNQLAFAKFATPIIAGGGLLLLFVLVTLVVSIRYTHRIYGPLVSIHRYLDELLGGQRPQPLHLRESDQLQDLAYKLNQVSERMMGDQRVGPMIAVHRFLDEMLAGRKPRPIHLREGDSLQELVGKLQTLSDQVYPAMASGSK